MAKKFRYKVEYKQPLIDLTVPEMTKAEKQAVCLWTVLRNVKEALEAREEGQIDAAHPSVPQHRLAEAYKILRAQLRTWTVDDFAANGLVDNLLTD